MASTSPRDADVIVALGGDGFMLQTLHRHGGLGKPVYGMKLGTVGFLMNHHDGDGLIERLHAAEPAVLRPLEMVAPDRIRRHRRLAGLQRGLAAAPDAAGRAPAHRPQRRDAPGRADLRRRAGRDAGRQHGLQLLRARPDPAAGRQRDRADADRRVPSAALARRAAQGRHRGASSSPRSLQAPGQRHRRFARGARRGRGRPSANRATAP